MGDTAEEHSDKPKQDTEEIVARLLAGNRVESVIAALRLTPDVVPVLCEVLKKIATMDGAEGGDALVSAVATMRTRVCFALEQLGPAAHQAKPALLSLLEEPEVDVRAAAADALGAIALYDNDAGVVRALLGHLRDQSAHVRAHCAHALACIGSFAHVAIWRLTRLVVRDRQPIVRAAAANALGSIAGRRQLSLYFIAWMPGAVQRTMISFKRWIAWLALRRACRDADRSVQHAASEAARSVSCE